MPATTEVLPFESFLRVANIQPGYNGTLDIYSMLAEASDYESFNWNLAT